MPASPADPAAARADDDDPIPRLVPTHPRRTAHRARVTVSDIGAPAADRSPFPLGVARHPRTTQLPGWASTSRPRVGTSRGGTPVDTLAPPGDYRSSDRCPRIDRRRPSTSRTERRLSGSKLLRMQPSPGRRPDRLARAGATTSLPWSWSHRPPRGCRRPWARSRGRRPPPATEACPRARSRRWRVAPRSRRTSAPEPSNSDGFAGGTPVGRSTRLGTSVRTSASRRADPVLEHLKPARLTRLPEEPVQGGLAEAAGDHDDTKARAREHHPEVGRRRGLPLPLAGPRDEDRLHVVLGRAVQQSRASRR